MLKFPNNKWRFDSPGAIPGEVVSEFRNLIGRIAAQADAKEIFEHFKSYFGAAAGIASTVSSSSTSWAETDLHRHMAQAADNAPLFIEAFYDGCESLRKQDLAVPDVAMVNRILAKYDTGYQIQPPNLIAHNTAQQLIEVPDAPSSLDEQARELVQRSLSQSEEFLSEGKNRHAVQEVLWLLETVSTAFKGMEIGEGATVQGKYFNKIVEEIRKHKHGTTLDRVLDWVMNLHGYLSSTTGGGIRHGTELKAGVATEAHEARLFCNLVRSYIAYLIAEHEQLTGSRKVLDA